MLSVRRFPSPAFFIDINFVRRGLTTKGGTQGLHFSLPISQCRALSWRMTPLKTLANVITKMIKAGGNPRLENNYLSRYYDFKNIHFHHILKYDIFFMTDILCYTVDFCWLCCFLTTHYIVVFLRTCYTMLFFCYCTLVCCQKMS